MAIEPKLCVLGESDACSMCPTRRPISGDGPLDARVMLIGSGPAYHEDREGYPFVGPTGEEYDGYLPLAGLHRDDVYTTNASKCWDRQQKKIPTARLEACADKHLQREILAIKPKHVVLMGGEVASLLLPGTNIELEHGRTSAGELYGHECQITTVYHPALGLHSTGDIRAIRDDFRRLGLTLDGANDWPIDRSAGHYLFSEATADNDYAFEPPEDDGPIGVDTETLGLWRWGHKVPAWCLSYSTSDTNGFLIRAGDREALRRFKALIRGREILLHKAPYDLPVLATMGVYPGKVIDTTILSYVRGFIGHAQGLKSLGYRELGVDMGEFLDLVRPYARVALVDYLTLAEALDYPAPGGRKRTISSRIRQFIKGVQEKDMDALKKWGNWDAAIKASIESAMEREAPKPTIDLAPFAEAMYYACLDANVTRRLYYHLLAMDLDQWKVARADYDLY